jgi:hypothetical protein
VSAQGDKYRNRPEEDQSTRRTAEDELMRGDRGVGQTGGGEAGGSGTAGRGIENEGSGSLLIENAETSGADDDRTSRKDEPQDAEAGSGSTKGGREPGVSGKRGMTGGLEKEGEGHSGPIRSGTGSGRQQDRAASGESEENARDGYEDHGSSRDEDGTQGESSGSRPGYH